MAIKNGRYKDKNGAVRHFETNENMVVVDGGQKTLKQKLSSLVESLSDLMNKLTGHETSKTAHEDIRAVVKTKADKTSLNELTTDRGYIRSKRVTDTSQRQNGIYTTWGDASGAPSGQVYGNYISTVGQDAKNIAELYLSASSNDGVWYRGGIHANNPEWKKLLTSDDGFINRNLNTTNVDTQRGNYVAGVSVTDNTGTVPFTGWNNIMQFDSKHFVTQLSAGVSSTESASKGLAVRSKWLSNENFSPWYEVALIERAGLTPLNGWTAVSADVETLNNITLNGSIVTVSALLTGGTLTTGTVIATLPNKFRPKKRTLVTALCCADSTFSYMPCALSVYPDGNIAIDANTKYSHRLMINVSFSV